MEGGKIATLLLIFLPPFRESSTFLPFLPLLPLDLQNEIGLVETWVR
jgi:hypothetical protein